MKIITIVGARPQFIKAAVVSREFAKHPEIQEVIIHTGQHYDANMSDVFFEEMQIPKPQYHLAIHGMSHGAMTGQMIEKIESILVMEKPEWVLVYGDTNSTLAGALAAKKLHIKVAHVEAGLRSFNMSMPEEVNRILTDRISDILFCPTQQAIKNLEAEGYRFLNIRIENIGDVMQDAALFYSKRAKAPAENVPEKFALCTVHRAENTDDIQRLKNIFDAIEEISGQIPVVLPLHPRTKAKLTAIGYPFATSNICFIKPVGYLEMVYLLQRAQLVLTDSGGLQKEAYFFSKYCITLRDETEWVELVNGGYNVLVGADVQKIIYQYRAFHSKEHKNFTDTMYGSGDAAEKIVRSMVNE